MLAAAQAQSYRPKNGFVPNPATAIKIAEAVLIPVYGKEKIESDRPFKAKLEGGAWTIWRKSIPSLRDHGTVRGHLGW